MYFYPNKGMGRFVASGQKMSQFKSETVNIKELDFEFEKKLARAFDGTYSVAPYADYRDPKENHVPASALVGKFIV